MYPEAVYAYTAGSGHVCIGILAQIDTDAHTLTAGMVD